MKGKGDIELLEGEKLLVSLHPHYLSFYDMYLIWAWVILLSCVFFIFGDQLVEIMGNPMGFIVGFAYEATSGSENILIQKLGLLHEGMGAINTLISPVNTFMVKYSPTGLWLSIILISSMAISVFKIEFKWIAALTGICIVSILVGVAFDLSPQSIYAIGIMLSIIGAGFVEIYRLAHTFYLTDRRIITQVKLIGQRQNELSYAKINNLVLEQGMIGRLFDFGTVIPITASGLGMGSDFAAMTIGAGSSSEDGSTVAAAITGGRSVQTPRVRSMFAIFGVKDPKKIQKIVSKNLHEFVEAPYLRSIDNKLSRLGPAVKDTEDKTD